LIATKQGLLFGALLFGILLHRTTTPSLLGIVLEALPFVAMDCQSKEGRLSIEEINHRALAFDELDPGTINGVIDTLSRAESLETGLKFLEVIVVSWLDVSSAIPMRILIDW